MSSASIVAPGGQRTVLELDSNGFLSEIRNPAGEAYEFTYDSAGLLRSMRDPRSKEYEFNYDEEGRLIRDEDPAGGSTELSRSGLSETYRITRTTAEGRVGSHEVTELEDGAREARVISFDGNELSFATNANAESHTASPEGSVTVTRTPDPRFGLLTPIRNSFFMTPQGRSIEISQNRSLQSSDPGDPFSSLLEATTETVLNGRIVTTIYDAAEGTITATSPEGRSHVSTLAPSGRLAQIEVPGLRRSYTRTTAEDCFKPCRRVIGR